MKGKTTSHLHVVTLESLEPRLLLSSVAVSIPYLPPQQELYSLGSDAVQLSAPFGSALSAGESSGPASPDAAFTKGIAPPSQSEPLLLDAGVGQFINVAGSEMTGSGTVIASAASVVYASVGTPIYEYTTPGTYLGWDDYDTTLSDLPGNQDVSLTSMRWSGGLASAGTAYFDFYEYSTSAWVAGFSVSLSSGYYIYTFSPNFVIPDHGILEVTATSAGKWRFTSTAPTAGSNNPNEGYPPDGYYHRFELTGSQNSPLPDDHGNDAAHATPVAVNSTTSGNIEVAGDQDWFSFQATAGKQYVLETVASGTLSTAPRK